MSIFNSGTSLMLSKWYESEEATNLLQQLRGQYGKKCSGILEKSLIRPEYEELSYKLFFNAKPDSLKSEAIRILSGDRIREHYYSQGIRKTNVFWPIKIHHKTVTFKLQCWEAGDSGMKKFSHILPACLEKADGLVFVFSFSDPNSFHDIVQNISNLKADEPNKPCVVVIGIRYFPNVDLPVSSSEIRKLEAKYNLSVLRIPHTIDDQSGLSTLAPVMCSICEQLWIRDQEFILKHSFDKVKITE